ncbi:hypothetical protein [Pedobacter frigiditerrae]|uniref:hypothetical protein n=1 Tax=Pedobacter frigiditerrae TaxID=2530452 RepID=UPI002931004E|nr:hypothetical protein [Pedobacter frigiditerrae]
MKNSGGEKLNNIKKAVWLYFLLLVFEGALRKWFLPGLATPLLVARDPVALYVIFMVWQTGNMPKSNYLTGMVVITVIAVFTGMLFGHGSLSVSLYGARILLIHFPFIFAMGRVFDREDVLQVGKVLLYVSIPMALLVAMQFYSPQSAWVNRGVGGDMAGAGFSGALGFFRPPGTFSFTNGTTLFFSFVAVYVIYFWLNPNIVSRWLLLGASIAVMVAIPLSISRSLLFGIGVSVMFSLLPALKGGKYFGQIIVVTIVVMLGLVGLNQMSFFQTATEAFTSRFETANTVEGGLNGVFADRYLGGLIAAIKSSAEQPFFGQGIGMGTNAGAALITGKGTTFLVSEGEWGRLIGEMGPVLGLLAISFRLGLSWDLARKAYSRLRINDTLPWILLSFVLLNLPQGQWAQPTSLGFGVFATGILIASLKFRPIPSSNPNLINQTQA